MAAALRQQPLTQGTTVSERTLTALMALSVDAMREALALLPQTLKEHGDNVKRKQEARANSLFQPTEPGSVPAVVRGMCPDAHSGVVPRGLIPVNIGTPGDKVQATFRVGTDGDDALPVQVPHEVGGAIMGRERGEDELKLASGMLVGASGLHLQ